MHDTVVESPYVILFFDCNLRIDVDDAVDCLSRANQQGTSVEFGVAGAQLLDGDKL